MSCRLVAICLGVLLAGCSPRAVEIAETPPPVVVAPLAPPPMPRPPRGAALNLPIPLRLPDGSYQTPNRGVSPAATLWHLRAALNVAALGCANPELTPGYNRLLAQHRKPLAQAHAALAREYGGANAYDVAMTRLYNYFAQPPAQAAFCSDAAAVVTEAQSVTPEALPGFATQALARLDRAFTDFYAAYDSYRFELAQWRAGQSGPKIAYDLSTLRMTDGAPRSMYADASGSARKRL